MCPQQTLLVYCTLWGVQWVLVGATSNVFKFDMTDTCRKTRIHGVERHVSTNKAGVIVYKPPSLWRDAHLKATLYNEAYEWTHETQLRDWTFTALSRPDALTEQNVFVPTGSALDCVHISYRSTVRMPHVLRRYVDIGNVETQVHKTVCVEANNVYNSITLEDLPIIGIVRIFSRMTLEDETLSTHVYAEFDLAWYLGMLYSTAENIVRQSYRDEVLATIHQLCSGDDAKLDMTVFPIKS